MERPCAQRTHRQLPNPADTQCSLEFHVPRVLVSPSREENTDGAGVEPPKGEHQRVRRRRIEPLNVVDGDQGWSALAQDLQHVAHRNRESAAIDGIA